MRVLATKELPALAALCFAALGWLIVRTADRITSAPLVEVAVDRQTSRTPGRDSMIVTVRNLSRDRMIKAMKVTIQGTLHSAQVRQNYDEPFPTTIGESVDSSGLHQLSLTVPHFHPGFVAVFQASVMKGDSLNVRVSSSADAVYVRMRSLQTRLARHEVSVLTLTLAGWTVLTIAYLFALRRIPEETAKGG